MSPASHISSSIGLLQLQQTSSPVRDHYFFLCGHLLGQVFLAYATDEVELENIGDSSILTGKKPVIYPVRKKDFGCKVPS